MTQAQRETSAFRCHTLHLSGTVWMYARVNKLWLLSVEWQRCYWKMYDSLSNISIFESMSQQLPSWWKVVVRDLGQNTLKAAPALPGGKKKKKNFRHQTGPQLSSRGSSTKGFEKLPRQGTTWGHSPWMLIIMVIIGPHAAHINQCSFYKADNFNIAKKETFT